MTRKNLIGILLSVFLLLGLFAYADGGRYGYGGHHGMMGGYGRGYCEGPRGMYQQEYNRNIDKAYVEDIAHNYVRGKKHLSVGSITEENREFVIEIVTRKEGSLVTKLFVDKRNGYTWSE